MRSEHPPSAETTAADARDPLVVAVACSLVDTNERDLVRALTTVEGLDIIVVTDSRNAPDVPALDTEDLYHTRSESRLLSVLTAVRPLRSHRFAALLDEIRPDIVLTLGASGLWNLPAVTGFTPAVFLPQGSETDRAIGRLWHGPFGRLKAVGHRFVFSQLLDHVAEVWTQAYARPTFEGLGLTSDQFVDFDWGPVDTTMFSPAVDPVSYVDDEDALVVGTFRRMRRVDMIGSSYDTLLAGVAQLVADGVAVHLVIGGYGFKDSAVESFVDDRIETLGLEPHVTRVEVVPKSELPSYYAGLDVYVNPTFAGTRVGGIGTGSKEAMACGCAFLTMNDPPMDYVIDHRENGLLVDHGDDDGLARELARLAHDVTELSALSTAARETVVDLFSHTAVGRRIEERCRAVVKDA